jgi:hypothetical protein
VEGHSLKGHVLVQHELVQTQTCLQNQSTLQPADLHIYSDRIAQLNTESFEYIRTKGPALSFDILTRLTTVQIFFGML